MPWQLPDGIDRMAVNAALTTLTEQWDLPSARLIVVAFCGLPRIHPNDSSTLTKCRRAQDTAVGLTPEHGLVKVQGPETVKLTQASGPPESAVARIGSFKVLHVHDSRSMVAAIAFGPFQKDPLVILEGRAPEPMFSVEYHRTTLMPLGLFRHDSVPSRPPLPAFLRCWLLGLCHPQTPIRLTCFRYEKVALHIITKEEVDSLCSTP